MPIIDQTSQTPNLQYLKGVGPKRVETLARIGIKTVRDLLYLFPRRYEDRTHIQPISDLTPGTTSTIRGTILSAHLKRLRRLQIVEISVGDNTGMIKGLWFNQGYLKKQLHEGMEIILYGRVELYKKQLQLTSPEFEIITDDTEETSHTGRITPIYPLTEGLFQKSLRKTIFDALQKHLDAVVYDFLPEDFREERELLNLKEAIQEMHFPESLETQAIARKRLVFDELFIFETILLRKIKALKTRYKSYTLEGGKVLLGEFQSGLPFTLTKAQKEVCLEIIASGLESFPMNRLLQGDVGSGKTIVAAFALLLAARNNLQGAFLVPTEILAEQHYKSLKKILEPFNLELALLTSSTLKAKREKQLALLKQGRIDIMIGTHSLLSEKVEFDKLAMVITDEQHKFGVHQRSQLLKQTPRPHQLVMTATPIPRTLALTIYGDLEISIMNELPKGRQPIKTYWITRKKQRQVLEHVLKRIQQGEQAYFVFPIIEETEKMDLLAATQEFEKLQKGVFKNIRIGLVHGKTKTEERDQIMNEFASNEVKVLVSTSVIEVGVDNPNATVMIIENAERFGLSQLHQLRGRIGRGSVASECFLFGEPTTTEGQMRLRTMTRVTDGFMIAEEDLKLRGPGDFLGTRQSGVPIFQLANPVTDLALLKEARKIAKGLIDSGELLSDPKWSQYKSYLENLNIKY